MKYLGLLWANLRRRRTRLIVTLLSILVAFFLYTYLSAVKTAFTAGFDVAGADRLVTIHKVSLIQLLPVSYAQRIAGVDGVDEVVHATWFGSYFQEPRNQLGMFPTTEAYLDLYPEMAVSDEHRDAWRRDRTGMLVGVTTMKRFGWQVGDRIPLTSSIWSNKDGTNTWEFTISGTYDAAKEGFDTTSILFHYEYFDEARGFGDGLVGWFIVRIDDPARTAEISEKIDALFANSPYETKTSSEKAFMQGFANQIGNIGAIFTAIVSVVFFTLLLVAGNTMAQSVRERISELAVLKTLGFEDASVLRIVLSESVVIMLIGGLLGLGLGWFLVFGFTQAMPATLPGAAVTPAALLTGVLLMLAAGIAAGIFPALKAMRLSIVEALARG